MFNAQGPNANCLTACAASNQAVGEATEIIRRGEADVMLSGGTHSMIHPFGVTGFNLLTALSTNNDNPEGASRPFDRLRDGFVLGEGSDAVGQIPPLSTSLFRLKIGYTGDYPNRSELECFS